jgi:hypothetical protein
MKMQQTKSYWWLAALAGVATAFVGAACTVTTSTDDNGGAGGAGTAGATAPGAGAGGATPTAGAAGAAIAGAGGAVATPYLCDVANGGAVGTPNVCTPAAGSEDDVCALCVQSKCCTEFSECYAYNPGNQCGYGGPNDMGEISCVQACIQQGVIDSGGVYDSTLIGTCANECTTQTANGSSKECGPVIGQQTSDLVGCLAENCQSPCFGG